EIIYKCSDHYAPDCDGAVRFDDPEIGINWGLTAAWVTSSKDKAAPLLAQINTPFVFEGN
ncbi:MAG: dTDP-4-dehydrorhamnose 3,5-epimerase, partial [Marinosulfonomonas sp.]|nr:dTDP-4-dehydrorhamnose 3,5-epimerase [Marinosulfonomonas sp.]